MVEIMGKPGSRKEAQGLKNQEESYSRSCAKKEMGGWAKRSERSILEARLKVTVKGAHWSKEMGGSLPKKKLGEGPREKNAGLGSGKKKQGGSLFGFLPGGGVRTKRRRSRVCWGNAAWGALGGGGGGNDKVAGQTSRDTRKVGPFPRGGAAPSRKRGVRKQKTLLTHHN